MISKVSVFIYYFYYFQYHNKQSNKKNSITYTEVYINFYLIDTLAKSSI